MIKKIRNIILGWFRLFRKQETEESKRRLAICMDCPDKIKIGNSWVCSICGCVCKAKVLVEDEKCLNGKW